MVSSPTLVPNSEVVKPAKIDLQRPPAAVETSSSPQVADNNLTSSNPPKSTVFATDTPDSQPSTTAEERTEKLTAILAEEATAPKTSADFKRLAVSLFGLLQTATAAERIILLEAHQDRLLLWARKSQDVELTRNVTRIILAPQASNNDTQLERLPQAPENVAPQTAPPPLLRNSLGMELVLIPAGEF